MTIDITEGGLGQLICEALTGEGAIQAEWVVLVAREIDLLP